MEAKTAAGLLMATLSRLARILAPLPDDATVPVGWLRDQIGSQPEPEDETELADLKVHELAAKLGRSASTVRGWCGSGELEGAYKLNGREWRIPPAAAKAFLNRQCKGIGSARAGPRRNVPADLASWRRHRSGD